MIFFANGGTKMKKTNVKQIDAQEEKKIIQNISLVSIIGNAALSAFKLFAGLLGHSNAMISDAIHSMSDVFTTFIALIGVKISKKQADKQHPYGHERLECVASLFLGVILFLVGIEIGLAGINTIFNGEYAKLQIPGLIALIAAIASIVTKEAMYWYTIYYAKILNSSAFMADAWHHRSDALSSIGSLIGIGGAMLGYPIMDSIASVVICIFILKVSLDISLDAIKKMLDTSCDEAFEKELSDFIASQPDVMRVDSLYTRLFGNKIYIDLEIAVIGEKTLNEAHEVAENVHTNVEKEYPNVKHIMIHVNPYEE